MFKFKKIIILLALGALGCLMPVPALAANGHNHGHNHGTAIDHSAHSKQNAGKPHCPERQDQKKCLHNGICYMGGLCAMLMRGCEHGAGNPGQTCSIANDCGKSSGGQGNSQSISKDFIHSAMFSQDISFACYLLRPPKEFSLAGFTGEPEDPPRVFPLL
ncbi:MAG: hypothetical protein HZA01_05745 [Nitrospinae bacterium]|nr:hypothetical protein [Nitrospinota bacterium]